MTKKLFSLILLGLLCSVGSCWGVTDSYNVTAWSGGTGSKTFKMANDAITVTAYIQAKTYDNTSSTKVAYVDGSNMLVFTATSACINSITLTGNTDDNSNTRKIKYATSTDGTTWGDYVTLNETFSSRRSTPDARTVSFATPVQYVRFLKAETNNISIGSISISITVSEDPSISASDASITATESGVEVTQDIAVTGSNLTGSTLTATISPAVTGLSVVLAASTITDGAISTKATLHYMQTANASGSTTLTLSDGTTSKNVTVNYTASVAEWELQSINKETTWDFETGITAGSKQYTSDDDKATEHVYANISELTFAASFDGTALSFKGEYPYRGGSYKFAQNGWLKFNTTVPGSVMVKFSNTGSNNDRYVKVNSTTGTIEADGTTKRTEVFHVNSSGDVTITGVNGTSSAEGTGANAAIRVYSITFTPVYTRTLTSGNWGTLCLPYDVKAGDYSGATFYSIAGKRTNNGEASGTPLSIVLEEVANNATLNAGQPYIFEATGSTLTAYQDNSKAAEASADSHNGLIGSFTAMNVTSGMYIIYNNGDTHEARMAGNGVTIGANKAYINLGSGEGAVPLYVESGEAPGRRIEIPLAPNTTTSLEDVEGTENTTKFFHNGQLYITREGVTYDALGRIVR